MIWVCRTHWNCLRIRDLKIGLHTGAKGMKILSLMKVCWWELILWKYSSAFIHCTRFVLGICREFVLWGKYSYFMMGRMMWQCDSVTYDMWQCDNVTWSCAGYAQWKSVLCMALCEMWSRSAEWYVRCDLTLQSALWDVIELCTALCEISHLVLQSTLWDVIELYTALWEMS